MMSGNIFFMDLRQQYYPQLCLGQYCCLISIKPHIVLITGSYLYNIASLYSSGTHLAKCDPHSTYVIKEVYQIYLDNHFVFIVPPSLYV